MTLTRIERKIIETGYWARKREREIDVLLTGLDLAHQHVLNIGAAHSPVRADRLPGRAARVVNLDIACFRSLDLVADGRRLPFDDEQFDVVMFLRVLHHINDFEQALAQGLRCTRTGGILLLSEPYHQAVALIKASGLDSHPRRVVARHDIEQFIRAHPLKVLRRWKRLYWFYYGYQIQKCDGTSRLDESRSMEASPRISARR